MVHSMVYKLTKTEKEILDYIHSGEFTIKDIANRRGCNKTFVWKVIRKLNKKGWKIDTKTIGSQKGGRVSQKVSLPIPMRVVKQDLPRPTKAMAAGLVKHCFSPAARARIAQMRKGAIDAEVVD